MDSSSANRGLGNRRGSLRVAKEAKDHFAQAVAEAKAEIKRENSVRKSLFAAFLRAHTVSELPKVETVVELDGKLSAVKGFDTLLESGILSAPVWDPDSNQYTGFLDVRDLVSSIIYAYDQQEHGPDIYNEAIVHAVSAGSSAPVSLTYLSRRTPFRSVEMTDTLFTVAQQLSHDNVHKVAVVGNDGRCSGIISQSSLLTFLHTHKGEMKEELTNSLADLKVGIKSNVITVDCTATAQEAFSVMDEVNLSGIAVVDGQGGLIGSTSAQDIKYFLLDKGRYSIKHPVLHFLGQIRQGDIKEQAVTCQVKHTATLGRCIDLLKSTGFHRIFIVDSRDRPIGVFSITDLLRLITDYQV